MDADAGSHLGISIESEPKHADAVCLPGCGKDTKTRERPGFHVGLLLGLFCRSLGIGVGVDAHDFPQAKARNLDGHLFSAYAGRGQRTKF